MKKRTIRTIISAFFVSCILLTFESCFFESKAWVIDEACVEVKTQVYKKYGEIPEVSGEIIYENDQDYIVVVTFKIYDDYVATRACHIYGYSEDNCFLEGMTKEMPENYEYDVEQLKALWGIK